MCRMFAYIGDSQADLARLHSALAKSAADDVLRKRFSDSGVHPDGWGYAIVAGNGIFHYRSAKPIFKDAHEVPGLEGRIFAVFHARKASNKALKGRHYFSHPFFAATGKKLIFLSHNGEIRVKVPRNSVDTEYAMDFVARHGLKAGAEEVKRLAKNFSNLLVMETERGTGRTSISYLNYYNKGVDQARRDYYCMHNARMAKGAAVVSSTLTKYGIRSSGIVSYGKMSVLRMPR